MYKASRQDLLHAGVNVQPYSLSRAAVWDSVFFVRIAQCGYEYEQFYAFFPLLPTFLRLLSFNGVPVGASCASACWAAPGAAVYSMATCA